MHPRLILYIFIFNKEMVIPPKKMLNKKVFFAGWGFDVKILVPHYLEISMWLLISHYNLYNLHANTSEVTLNCQFVDASSPDSSWGLPHLKSEYPAHARQLRGSGVMCEHWCDVNERVQSTRPTSRTQISTSLPRLPCLLVSSRTQPNYNHHGFNCVCGEFANRK